MKLIYTLGNAGSGKFYRCIENILERQKKGEQSILIIPEQFTLQAEKKIIELSENNILFNTNVLNFKRLAYRIFSELGVPEEKPLEDIGQIILIRKILYNLGKEKKLNYFDESAYNNLGLIEKVLIIIKEFLQFGVLIEDLEKSIKNIDSTKSENLILKLLDLKEIYIKYKEFINKEYITEEGILDILSSKIEESTLINENTKIFIYGFEEFNNQELNILYKLFGKSKEIDIYFTLNTKQTYYKDLNIFDPYYNIKNTINKINDKILNKLNINEKEVIFLEENKRHKNNKELKFLEENFFAYPYNEYLDVVKNIEIIATKNKYIEIEKIAEKILLLVKNENYRYKDIAIIIGDKAYESSLKMIFNKYNIPYFLDDKKKITNHSLVELIISLIDIIVYNFQYESVFRYLKTGYLDTLNIYNINKEKINLIENYILKYGIKGDKWKKDFTYGFYEGSLYKQEEINEIRENILLSLSKLHLTKNKKYTSLEICTSILDFFVDIKIEDTIKFIIDRDEKLFEQEIIKNAGNTDEYIQVFNSICEIFQKFVEILAEEKLTLEEFSKLLKTAFEKETISIIPPKQDQILIGNFDRTKICDNKILFAIGINEGNVPSYKEESPFISDAEKVVLIANGIELKNFSTTTLSTDMLKIYSLILKPIDRLFLTYSISTLDGASKKPSIIIEKIKDIFPKLKEEKIEENSLDIFSSPDIIFERIFKNFSFIENNIEKTSLKETAKWFLNNPIYSEKLKQIEKSIKKLDINKDEYINQENLKDLYNENKMFSSISKLEEFNKCPFSYFLKYNLGLRERDLHILDYLKLGNLYHNILEEFSKEVFNKNFDIKDISKKQIYNIIENITTQICDKENFSSVFQVSAKYKYYLNRVKKITSMSANAIIEQLKTGDFSPEEFEINFDDINNNSKVYNNIKIPLDNDFMMILKGKIDRVDKLFLEDKEYIKIVDYKSSDKKLNIEEVYYGLQLQILMYLNTFIKIEKDITKKDIMPAGAFYFQVQEAILKEDKEEIDLQKEFNMKGIIAKEQVVIKGLDKDYKEGGSIKIKGVSSSDIVSMEEFEKLLELSNVITKDIGNEIIKGNIKVNPYKYNENKGCDYCNFKDICQIELLDKNNKYKYLKCFEKEEIWDKIDEKINKK